MIKGLIASLAISVLCLVGAGAIGFRMGQMWELSMVPKNEHYQRMVAACDRNSAATAAFTSSLHRYQAIWGERP